jgi:hypothetical protein
MKKATNWIGYISCVALATLVLPFIAYLVDFPEFEMPKIINLIGAVVCGILTIILAIMVIRDRVALRKGKDIQPAHRITKKDGIGIAVGVAFTVILFFKYFMNISWISPW